MTTLAGNICPDCGKHFEIGDWPYPCAGLGHELGSFWHGDSAIHTSEAVTVFTNPETGDIKIPGRGDRPIHPKLAAAGYRRETINTAAGIRDLEKKKNLVHEASNYNNSGAAERDTGST
jgi:hypothetical protein